MTDITDDVIEDVAPLEPYLPEPYAYIKIDVHAAAITCVAEPSHDTVRVWNLNQIEKAFAKLQRQRERQAVADDAIHEGDGNGSAFCGLEWVDAKTPPEPETIVLVRYDTPDWSPNTPTQYGVAKYSPFGANRNWWSPYGIPETRRDPNAWCYIESAAPSPELISPHPIVEELTKE
jgi:hypothetical protein